LNEIQNLLKEYEILISRISDLEEALSIGRKPNAFISLLKKEQPKPAQKLKMNLPDPRLIEFKKDRFVEQLSEIKKKLFDIFIKLIEKISANLDDLLSKKEDLVIKLEKDFQIDKDLWLFISELFHINYPLKIFDCIFTFNEIRISTNKDIKKSLYRALEFLKFASKAECNEIEEISIMRMNWELLMRTTIKNNMYAKIFRKVGMSEKPINIQDFCTSENLEINEIKKTIDELSIFSPHAGLKFPVIEKLESGYFTLNCYGKFLWEKFGFILNEKIAALV